MSDPLTVGSCVRGLDGVGWVTVLKVTDLGGGTLEVTYRDTFDRDTTRILFPADLRGLEVQLPATGPTFDANREWFRLAFDALCLRYGHLLSPYFAVYTSNIDPLPHQIQAVYDFMLPRRPMRFLLADDPGAGKTIMAGLYLKEVLARGDVTRALIVVPGGLINQWHEELRSRFGLRFTVFDRDLDRSSPSNNAFADRDLVLARLDQLARDRNLRDKAVKAGWGLVVFDEAHKLTARYWGNEVKRSKRFELARALAPSTDHLLLMTATPHNGKEEDFQLFLSLLDRDRFAGTARTHGPVHPCDIMRRLVKEQLRTRDAEPLFPERHASTVTYRLSEPELELYEQVTEYVREEMNKIAGDDARRSVGFALLVLQRRLASSPEAILQSLIRRRERLRNEADRRRQASMDLEVALTASLDLDDADDDAYTAEHLDRLEEESMQSASAARTLEDLQTEILVLDDLVELAQRVRDAGVDRKWEALAGLLTSDELYDEQAHRRRIIIFTEHRDTLDYLAGRIAELLGSQRGIVTVHGGTPHGERLAAIDAFWHDDAATVMLATDAAGEGVNLQCAHLMVNYDLPWNPNRLEQRFGRIHRIGQRHVCHLWNLVAAETREGDVFETLLRKLETQRQALGDQVFDVLGYVLTGADLRRLLTDALRSDSMTTSHDAIADQVEQSLGRDMGKAIERRHRSVSEFTPDDIVELNATLDEAERLTVQPLVESFTLDVLRRLHGDIRPTTPGRFRIDRLPAEIRGSASTVGTVARRYEVVAFDADRVDEPGTEPAELLSPGHPVIDALVRHVLDQHGHELREGIAIIDPEATDPGVMVVCRHDVTTPDGAVLSERLVALRCTSSGPVRVVDPRMLADAEPSAAPEYPPENLIHRALDWCAAEVGPAHLEEVSRRLREQHRHAHRAATERLVAEIDKLTDGAGRSHGGDPKHREGADVVEQLVTRLRGRLAERQTQLAKSIAAVDGGITLLAVAYMRPGRR